MMSFLFHLNKLRPDLTMGPSTNCIKNGAGSWIWGEHAQTNLAKLRGVAGWTCGVFQ
jgi:hypothetical protein